MTRQVPWNKYIVEEFVELAMLSKEEEMILRTRVEGWTITKQALEFGMSESSVNRTVAMLKKKYDNVEKYSALLPPRKESAKELYMDEN